LAGEELGAGEVAGAGAGAGAGRAEVRVWRGRRRRMVGMAGNFILWVLCGGGSVKEGLDSWVCFG
jgi:hypothetical protein